MDPESYGWMDSDQCYPPDIGEECSIRWAYASNQTAREARCAAHDLALSPTFMLSDTLASIQWEEQCEDVEEMCRKARQKALEQVIMDAVLRTATAPTRITATGTWTV